MIRNAFSLRLNSLWFGLTLPARALSTIARNPTLLFWSLLPLSITLSLYVFVIVRLQAAAVAQVSSWLTTWGWSADGIAATVILVLTRIALLLVGALTFSFVASIAASPFNDVLAEKTESRALPPLPPVGAVSVGAKVRLLLLDLLKTVCATVASLAALALSWIPIVNFAAMAIAFLLVCFQYTSYPQTRRGQGFREGLGFLWRHAWACGAFGFTLTVLFAIPLVASVAVPLAVVGGTLLVARARGGHGYPPLK